MRLTRTMRIAAAVVLLAAVTGCDAAAEGPQGGTSQAPSAKEVHVAPQPPSDTADWPVFRGNPAGTGVAQSSLAESLEVVWKFKPGGTIFLAAAAIVGDSVYIGDGDNFFYALDLSNGHVRWKFPADHGFEAAPAVRDGRVYIGDAAGNFHCLDAATGRELWKFPTGAEINSSANFFDDSVLFGSQDGLLYRLRCKDGSLVWKFSIADSGSDKVDGGIQSSPTVVDSLVYFAACDSKLHVLEAATGKSHAVLNIGGPTLSTLAISGDFAYVGTMWGDYFAVARKPPKVAWLYRNPQGNSEYSSSPAVSGDWVVIASHGKRVEGLRRSDGKSMWNYASGGRVDSSPVIAGSRVFFGAADGRIYCLDLATGRLKWKFSAGGNFAAAPAVGRNRLVIGNHNGTVYCFGPKEAK